MGTNEFTVTGVPAGQKGRIWVDRESFRVLKLEYKATDIPADFPIKAVESAIDYDWVTIADGKYLLPTLSETRFTQKASVGLVQARNVIRFRNYQKYGTEVKAVGDEEDVPPEKP